MAVSKKIKIPRNVAISLILDTRSPQLINAYLSRFADVPVKHSENKTWSSTLFHRLYPVHSDMLENQIFRIAARQTEFTMEVQTQSAFGQSPHNNLRPPAIHLPLSALPLSEICNKISEQFQKMGVEKERWKTDFELLSETNIRRRPTVNIGRDVHHSLLDQILADKDGPPLHLTAIGLRLAANWSHLPKKEQDDHLPSSWVKDFPFRRLDGETDDATA
jgi:hypothetical protein